MHSSEFGTAGFIASIAMCLLLQQRNQKNKKKKQGPVVSIIEELWLFPIKGCKGFKVNSAVMTPRGLEFDRSFVIVDASTNRFVSQRCHPKMALFHTRIDYNKLQLIVEPSKDLVIPSDSSSTKSLILSLAAEDYIEAPQLTATVWGQDCQAVSKQYA